MDVHHLLYASRAVGKLDDAQILAILEVSRRNNLRLGVTGLLIYREGRFVQLLEGEKDVVRAVYAKIAEDRRHGDERVLIEATSEARIFPEWSMGYVDPKRSQAALARLWPLIERQVALSPTEKAGILPILRTFNQAA